LETTGPPPPSGRLLNSICDSNASPEGAFAYACVDWSVGSLAMERAADSAGMASTHTFGVGSYGSGSENMGKVR
jgi:hypothetical protein